MIFSLLLIILMKTTLLANAKKNFIPLTRQLVAIYTKICPCYTHFRLEDIISKE
jgi:hypothetical protein